MLDMVSTNEMLDNQPTSVRIKESVNASLNFVNYFFSDNEWYWVINHSIRVSEFTVDPNNPNIADHDSEMVLLQVDQPAANHNGGMIFFGVDGYLYVSLGDGGGAGDQYRNALNLTTLLGKILRIDVNVKDKFYGIPPDNPFVKHKHIRPEIYAYGARNMWRCSIDRGDKNESDGRIFCGDVGQSRVEEINVIRKGKNYGWSAFEGSKCYNKTLCSMFQANLTFPIISYDHSIGQSVVGGYVYRGCDNPKLVGRYIYGDTMNGHLFLAKETNKIWVTMDISMGNESLCNRGLTGNYYRTILSFGENEAGELFVLSARWPKPYYKTSKLYRIVDPLLRGDPELCKPRVKTPQKLETLRRRNIYKKYIAVLKSKKTDSTCEDRRHGCMKYFSNRNGKKPKYSCIKWKKYTIIFCKRTCKFC